MTPPSPSIAGLIAELRATATCQRNCMGRCDRCPMDMAESVISELQSLSTDLAAAKGALEPFADLADAYSDTFSNNLKLSVEESNNGHSTYAFTLGDLRYAAEILQPKVETP